MVQTNQKQWLYNLDNCNTITLISCNCIFNIFLILNINYICCCKSHLSYQCLSLLFSLLIFLLYSQISIGKGEPNFSDWCCHRHHILALWIVDVSNICSGVIDRLKIIIAKGGQGLVWVFIHGLETVTWDLRDLVKFNKVSWDPDLKSKVKPQGKLPQLERAQLMSVSFPASTEKSPHLPFETGQKNKMWRLEINVSGFCDQCVCHSFLLLGTSDNTFFETPKNITRHMQSHGKMKMHSCLSNCT